MPWRPLQALDFRTGAVRPLVREGKSACSVTKLDTVRVQLQRAPARGLHGLKSISVAVPRFVSPYINVVDLLQDVHTLTHPHIHTA